MKISKTKKTDLAALARSAQVFLNCSTSEATKEAYRSDWAGFVQWCDDNALAPLPAAAPTVALYITWLAEQGRAPSTISRHLTTISQAHKAAKLDTPTRALEVTKVYQGIRRKKGTAQKRAKPLLVADLKKVIDSLRPTFLGRRDAALFMLGWAGALRRSEIVAIDRADLEFVDEGLILTITKSKTDQEGAGYRLGIPYGQDKKYCPVHRVKHWLDLAKIDSGPVFYSIGTPGKQFHAKVDKPIRLSPRYINTIIKKRIEGAGLKPNGYSGHSLRAGFVTSAAKLQTPEHVIQVHTRHRSTRVLRGYIHEGGLFESNPLAIML